MEGKWRFVGVSMEGKWRFVVEDMEGTIAAIEDVAVVAKTAAIEAAVVLAGGTVVAAAIQVAVADFASCHYGASCPRTDFDVHL